jgi:hypothetical protein
VLVFRSCSYDDLAATENLQGQGEVVPLVRPRGHAPGNASDVGPAQMPSGVPEVTQLDVTVQDGNYRARTC